MDEYKYSERPKVRFEVEGELFRVVFHKGHKADDWKDRIVGKKFTSEKEGGEWANMVFAMARTKCSTFESLDWKDQTPILQNIIKTTSDKELQANWENRT